jgi:hypothetical protein
MSLWFNTSTDSSDIASLLKNDYELSKLNKLRAEGNIEEADKLAEKIKNRNITHAKYDINLFKGFMIIIVLIVITYVFIVYVKIQTVNKVIYAIDAIAICAFVSYAFYVKVSKLKSALS